MTTKDVAAELVKMELAFGQPVQAGLRARQAIEFGQHFQSAIQRADGAG